MKFSRYAIYYLPDDPLFQLGSDWLGWNSLTGHELVLSDEQCTITERPRKYGFHATVKPPFSLAPEYTQDDLQNAFCEFCLSAPPALGGMLQINRLGRFLAITQDQQTNEVREIAATTVSHFDKFRAPLSEQDIEKRRQNKLTAQQDALMLRWGYPYVMQEFKFHMTLTGPLPKPEIEHIEHRAQGIFREHLGRALNINSLALLGQDKDSGRFHVIKKQPFGT